MEVEDELTKKSKTEINFGHLKNRHVLVAIFLTKNG